MTKAEKLALRQEYNKPSVRAEIVQTCGTVCVNCGTDTEIEYHHIVPLANGGSNRLSNLVALCHECHLRAHGKLQRVSDMNREKIGRKKIAKPYYADTIIENYLTGIITRKEAHSRLKLRPAWKIKELWYFQEYLESHGIESYRNYVDSRFNSRSKEVAEPEYLAAVIRYKDGREEKFYRITGLRKLRNELQARESV